ncbi:MAG: hypothetical protein V3T77_01770 [Planctomycetota bacterium]
MSCAGYRGLLARMALAVLLGGGFLFADQWMPYQFKGPALYKYKVMRHGGQESQVPAEAVYTLDITESEKKDSSGDSLYQIVCSVQAYLPKKDVGSNTFMGMSGLLAAAPATALLNPMFSMAYSQVDLKVGEEQLLFDTIRIKVTGEESIAGVKGFVCEIYTKQKDKEVKSSDMVVHPELILPLRSRVYSDGKLQSEMLLLDYQKH